MLNKNYNFAIYYSAQSNKTFFDICERRWRLYPAWEAWLVDETTHEDCLLDDDGECDECFATCDSTYDLFEKFEEIPSNSLNNVDVFESSTPT